jgi:hypothetical protein
MLLPACRLFTLLNAAAAVSAVGVLGAASRLPTALKRSGNDLNTCQTKSATPAMCGCLTQRCVMESSRQVSCSTAAPSAAAVATQQWCTAATGFVDY